MRFVLDASYVLAIAFGEGDQANASDVLDWIASNEAHAPELWRFEVGNALLMAIRRNRLTAETAVDILQDVQALPVRIDPHGGAHCWTTSLALAQRHGLTLYDAAYLELAMRLGAPLASLDRALLGAARKESVTVLGA